MNRAEQLYTNLSSLVESNEAFYFVDHVFNDITYRVFTYRLASYTDFLNPDALECRGHMFMLDSTPKLVSLPMEKFFNLNENPFTMDLDLSDVDFIHDKRDGSLISTYMNAEGKVCLKSKTALSSDQALAANNLLYSDARLLDIVSEYVRQGMTVNFEYTAPDNRIVLPYQERELKVLNVRNHYDLSYMPFDLLYKDFDGYMVDDHTRNYSHDVQEFVNNIPSMTGIEGFVIGLADGQRIKIKTEEYLNLHRTKDAVMSDKALFACCLNAEVDDLRSLFHDDQFVLDRINKMEKIANHAYNTTVMNVESYHENNKHLDRKDYAIKGQQELSRLEFNLTMQLYSGKIPNYKEMVLRNFEQFLGDNS